MITVDARRCLSSGYCVEQAPELFTRDEDGLVVLLQPNPPAELLEAARAAAVACPAAVISLHQDEEAK
jgi:ferredoxin